MITLISKEKIQYKANLHCHSVISDGKLTPKALKEAYKNAGYSILAITDHEAPHDHSAMSEKDFLMITGYEAYIRPDKNCTYDKYSPEVHINLFAKEPSNIGLVNYNPQYCKYIKDPAEKEAIPKVGDFSPREYTVDYVNKFIRDAKENGYICAHNHATWSMESEEYLLGYDGFFSMEMCNYSSYISNRFEYNAAIYDKLLKKGKRIFCHSADDNHNVRPFGHPACDSFGGFTMIMADSLTYNSAIEALENGNFYSSIGPKIHELTLDGSHVHIETDPVEQITLYHGSKIPHFVIESEENPVTSADFEIPEKAAFIRIGAVDFRGRHADTRGFFREELGI